MSGPQQAPEGQLPWTPPGTQGPDARPAASWPAGTFDGQPDTPARRALRRRHRIALVAGLAVLLLVAAGAVLAITGSRHQVDPAQALRSAVDRTLASSTVRVTQDAQISDATGLLSHVVVQGQADLVHNQGDTVVSAGTNRLQIVTDGRTAWFSSTAAAFASQLPTGAAWAVGDATQLATAGYLHPAADSIAALYLTRGAGTVHPDGPDQVNGIAAHRYSFPIDLQRAYCATDATERPAVQRSFYVDRPATIAGQAWIDGKGRVLKFVVTATATDTVNGPRLRDEDDLTAFNAAISITPPPADQAAPVTPTLMAALGISNGNRPPAVCP